MNKAIIDGQQQPVHSGAGGLVTSGVLPADVVSAPGVTRDSRGKFVAGGAGKNAAVGESNAGGAGDARGAADEPPTSELPSAVGGPGKDAAGGAGAAGETLEEDSVVSPGGGGAGNLCGSYPVERTKHRSDGPRQGPGGAARAPAGANKSLSKR